MTDYNNLAQAIVKGQKDKVAVLTKQAVDEGCDTQEILEKGFFKSFSAVDEKMKTGKMFIPDVLLAAKAARCGMDVLNSALSKENKINEGTLIIGTVKGDFHHASKEIVTRMCKWVGLKTIDLGLDVGWDEFIEKAEKHNADVICLSAFQPEISTSAITEMEKTVAVTKQKKMDRKVKVLIASHAISQSYFKKIDAHAYASNALMVVRKARNLISN